MRVTQSMIANRSMVGISKSYGQMDKYQRQIETGKKINRPSDDPVVAMKGVKDRTKLSEIEQYQRNASEAYTFFEATDTAYDQAGQVIQRARELAVQLSNGTLTTEDRTAAAEEIKQLKGQMIDVANTQIGGKYIFSGTEVKTQPFTQDAAGNVTFNGNTNAMSIEVTNGVQLQINSPADKVFTGTPSVFAEFDSFIYGLEPNKEDQIASFIDKSDNMINALNVARAEVGARENRLELIDDRNKSTEIFVTKVLSENEDVDMEKVIMNLKIQESIHNAALSVGARIIQPSLMDFLR